jgi:hypothetical protein
MHTNTIAIFSKKSFIAENGHLIESKDRESSVIQTGSILNSILGAHSHWLLFVTSGHSREAGSSKDHQPGRTDRCTGNQW